MHYYKFNIPSWVLHTAHLSLVEEAIYLRLINFYYDSEALIPLETQSVFRKLRLGNDSVLAEEILNEFFIKTEKGYSHSLCDKLVAEYKKTATKNKRNGAKGGRPRRGAALKETQTKPSGLIKETQTKPKHNPNQEPLTINHKPINKPHSTPAKPKYEDRDFEFANKAFEEIQKHTPDFKKPNLETWAKDVRLMREKDNRDLTDMAEVWVWCHRDSFEQANVHSISKFRKRFDQLKIKSKGRVNEVNQRSDNSAAGRVRAKVKAELEQIKSGGQGENSAPLAINDKPLWS